MASQAHFLRTLFEALDERGIRYCVLHSYEDLPDQLHSDLDLAVHPQDAGKLSFVFQTLQEIGYWPIQHFYYSVKSYAFVFVWFENLTAKAVIVDIIFEHRRRGFILTSGKDLVAGRQKRGFFWVPRPAAEFAYLLAKKTLKEGLPKHQARRLKQLVEELGRPEAESIAGRLFGEKWKLKVVEACLNDSFGSLLRKLTRQISWRILARDPLNPVRHRLADTLRLVRRWFQPTGLFMTVQGPDGVGKSTVINQLTLTLSPAFRRIRMFHWRPAFLFREREIGEVREPHGRPVRPAWLSAAILLARYLDYLLGYAFAIRRFEARTDLVIFHRYFDDVVIDPKRYRYGGPQWLGRALSPFVPKPELMLVLDAPPEVIISRKGELHEKELERQRQAYLEMAEKSSRGRVIDASGPIEQVCRDAAWTITEYMARRFRERSGWWSRQAPPSQGHAARTSPEEVLDDALCSFAGSPEPTAAANFVIHSNGNGHKPGASVRNHDFVVLPSRKSPRLLLPVGDPEITLRGLQVYTPYAAAARMAKNLLAGAIQLRWQGLGRHRVSVTAEGPLPLEDLVREITGETRPAFALLLGTSGSYRKMTVQVMRRQGEILGFLKLPLTPGAADRIRNEAEMLRRLSEYGCLRAHIPEVLYADEWGDGYLLFQTANPGRTGGIEFGPSHEKFLETLWGAHRIEKPGDELVEETAQRWREAEPHLDSEWRELGEKALERASESLTGQRVRCGISHGDFAPWNTRVDNGSLFAFDWEHAAPCAPNLWDVFHFHVQVNSLLRPRKPSDPLEGRAAAEKASFLLFLLDSICRVLDEEPDGADAIMYRQRVLLQALSSEGIR